MKSSRADGLAAAMIQVASCGRRTGENSHDALERRGKGIAGESRGQGKCKIKEKIRPTLLRLCCPNFGLV